MEPRNTRLQKVVRIVLFWYVSNVLWNLYQLGHNDLSKLINYQSVLAVLYLPGPLSNPATPIWVYVLFVLIFVGLWIWTSNGLSRLLDKSREHAVTTSWRSPTQKSKLLEFIQGHRYSLPFILVAIGAIIIGISTNNFPAGILVVEAGILIGESFCTNILDNSSSLFWSFIVGLIMGTLCAAFICSVTIGIMSTFVPSFFSIINNTKLNVVVLSMGVLVFVGGEALAVAVDYGWGLPPKEDNIGTI